SSLLFSPCYYCCANLMITLFGSAYAFKIDLEIKLDSARVLGSDVAMENSAEDKFKEFYIPTYILDPDPEVEQVSSTQVRPPSCPVIVFINSKSGAESLPLKDPALPLKTRCGSATKASCRCFATEKNTAAALSLTNKLPLRCHSKKTSCCYAKRKQTAALLLKNNLRH
ncbi:hypothetical protein AKJ16_DCAP27293, partial [Drosera capensis]